MTPTDKAQVIRVAVFDGDVLCYRFSQAGDPIEWEPGVVSNNNEATFKTVDDYIQAVLTRIACKKAVIALSSPTNFRKAIYPEYKANRKAKVKPAMHPAIRSYMCENYDTVCLVDCEGDDALSWYSTNPLYSHQQNIIVSIDKDLNGVPGFLFNPDKSWDEVLEISEAQALRFHMLQTLVGDSVDHYPGLPGVGLVRANAILAKAEEQTGDGTDLEYLYWTAVVDAYESKGLAEADALVQARIAKIYCHQDFDGLTPIPWTPKGGLLNASPECSSNFLKPARCREEYPEPILGEQPEIHTP